MTTSLAKTESKTTGYFLLIIGMVAELFILFGSIVIGSDISSRKPWLYALTQIIPLIFIEGGLVRIKQSKNFNIGEIETRKALDEVSLTIGRTYSIYKNINAIISGVILLIALAFFAFFMFTTRGAQFKSPAWYTFGFLVLYIVVIRPLSRGLYKVIRSKTRGVGLKYSFDSDSLLLKIPINPLQKKTAIIPLSKIEDCRIPNSAEYISLMQSYERQYTIGFSEIRGLGRFAKDEIPYPQYYRNTINPMNAVYLKGKDFVYLISVENAEYFVNEIKRRKK